MRKLNVTDFNIYNFRYPLGYALIALLFITILVMASLKVPGGISPREMTAIANSDALSLKNFSSEMIVNIPYYLLQKTSLVLFGSSILSIKLPSIIIAAGTALGIVLLLNMWFRRNIAVLTSLIAFSAGPFLLAVQSGTPGILYIFWSTWILLAASKISRSGTKPSLFWLITLFTVVGMSLYTPLSSYILIALIGATLFHPHLRYIIRNVPKTKFSIAAIMSLLLIIPLVYSLVKNPSLVLELLGIAGNIDIMANLQTLALQYGQFFNPENSIIMTPIYSLPIVLLCGLGLYRMVTTKYTARSYIVTAWIIMLAVLVIINPQFINVTFIPVTILAGYGIELLIRSWYKIFPLNPYARVAGLIPLIILIGTLVLSSFDRFTYGYLYNPTAATVYTQDLTIFKQVAKSSKPNNVIVSPAEEDFYRAIVRYDKNLSDSITVSTRLPEQASGTTVTTRAARSSMPDTATITSIATNGLSQESDRLYLYSLKK